MDFRLNNEEHIINENALYFYCYDTDGKKEICKALYMIGCESLYGGYRVIKLFTDTECMISRNNHNTKTEAIQSLLNVFNVVISVTIDGFEDETMILKRI